ncbi:MAG TPA: purine-nucleoside phosphorylase [Gemmatimonadaceae bacterium]|nr:purine-nucleoside phosphorylase [Gemmatimonadaceae bacterium]
MRAAALPDASYRTAEARAAADHVRSRFGDLRPVAALILGSGLGGLADRITEAERIPFAQIPGFPSATVAGHAGALISGKLAGRPVLALAGRFHMYEGHAAALAAFPTRVLAALGAKTLIVSNAAGGVRPSLKPGDLMLIRDHINFMFRNPLIGPAGPDEVRFPDMSSPYDERLCALARQVAREEHIVLTEGVYCGLLGPTYETPAEVRMLSFLGADAVGMSTVPEVIVAHALGIRALGVSCVTNLACGLSTRPITHAEVMETTARVAARFERLVSGVVARL